MAAAVAERSAFKLIHQAYVIKADCIVRKESDYRRTEFAQQLRRPIEGHGLAIVAPEDLIISKLDWMRETRSEIQLADVRDLLRSVADLDRQYLTSRHRGGRGGARVKACARNQVDVLLLDGHCPPPEGLPARRVNDDRTEALF